MSRRGGARRAAGREKNAVAAAPASERVSAPSCGVLSQRNTTRGATPREHHLPDLLVLRWRDGVPRHCAIRPPLPERFFFHVRASRNRQKARKRVAGKTRPTTALRDVKSRTGAARPGAERYFFQETRTKHVRARCNEYHGVCVILSCTQYVLVLRQ